MAEIFNEFFTIVASDIGFDDAIRRHKDNPSVQKIQQEFDKIESSNLVLLLWIW